jgi:choline kinase
VKAIILAAGCGRRLRPYTVDRPKCLLPFAGQPLLRHQLRTLRHCGIDDIVIVKGYRAEQIVEPGLRGYVNADYATSNVALSLACAASELEEEVVIWYGDMICEPRLLEHLLSASHGDLLAAVDDDWRPYYQARSGDDGATRAGWLIDAEDRIVRTRRNAERAEGREVQFIGLLRCRPAGCAALRDLLRDAASTPLRQAFMADVIDALRARDCCVQAAVNQRGWLEFDTTDDYEQAQRWHEEGSLRRFLTLA